MKRTKYSNLTNNPLEWQNYQIIRNNIVITVDGVKSSGVGNSYLEA